MANRNFGLFRYVFCVVVLISAFQNCGVSFSESASNNGEPYEGLTTGETDGLVGSPTPTPSPSPTPNSNGLYNIAIICKPTTPHYFFANIFGGLIQGTQSHGISVEYTYNGQKTYKVFPVNAMDSVYDLGGIQLANTGIQIEQAEIVAAQSKLYLTWTKENQLSEETEFQCIQD